MTICKLEKLSNITKNYGGRKKTYIFYNYF